MTGAPPGPVVTAYDWLRQHARARPDAFAVTVWQDGAARQRLTFGALAGLVDRVAAGLAARGARAGDRVVLALPNDLSFTATLLAALAVGLVPVPAPTPDAVRQGAFEERLRGIVADCRPGLVVTTDAWTPALHRALRGACGPPAHTWEALSTADPEPAPGVRSGPRPGIALLQYTSGSTGTPKGVVISHRALAAQCAQSALAYRERLDDTAVTWVPLHHDMGLVTGLFRPLYTGYESVLLSPRAFVRDPGAWLAALTHCRGTLSSAPDFGYRHCVRRITPAAAGTFDLSSWRVARNAGEVVRADTAADFTARFTPAGFRADALCPSYGMAEATLTVTAATPWAPSAELTVRRDDLRRGTAVQVGPDADPAAPTVTLLSSGRTLPRTRVTVRTADGGTAPDGTVGDILVQGPQLFSGYWPDTASAAGGGPGAWHATGDTGFLLRGHLFVLGRADDTLVHHGRKFYAADVLAVCATVPRLRPGRCAVFTVEAPGPDGRDTPQVCLVAEVGEDAAAPTPAVVHEIRRRLADALDLYVTTVALVPAGELPVTTSGKVRVADTRRRYRRGTLRVLPVPARTRAAGAAARQALP
ncbi:AMP-binding protein [Streptomyces sp. NPDC046870]|uniref:AMP-binding protein n=1 Tax=Streptomyces sp. NPDC046870 TaxID=3155135 RepID=UPI00345733F9